MKIFVAKISRKAIVALGIHISFIDTTCVWVIKVTFNNGDVEPLMLVLPILQHCLSTRM
jgi:hypothetical protein